MTKTSVKLFALITLVVVLSGCGGGNGTPPDNPPVVTHAWTWVSGSNMASQTGIYGTKGTGSPSNVPGARYGAVSWIDSSGKLWLFGGAGYDSGYYSLNDLWKYDLMTNEWTWVSGSNARNQAGIYGTQGTSDPANVPGARYGAVSWIDSNGKFWLFGGNSRNDLWRYDPTTLEWTWISGSDSGDQLGIYGTKGIADSLNVPGARSGAVSWIDSSGELWLFGGSGRDSASPFASPLNDLWRYDPTTLEWTWISGNDSGDQLGIYGTKGIADSLNVPGARSGAVSWIDSSGKLWLFGGYGPDPAGSGARGEFNDLWRYDPTTNEWTWVSGSNTLVQQGTYGRKGKADPANVPGAREQAVSWLDSSGKLWLFGGGYWGTLNDLWTYDPTANEWTWVSGSNSTFQSGVYGAKGTAGSSNVPGSRHWAISWLDSSGNLWLFGGWGNDSTVYNGPLNDLWRYTR